MWMPPMGTQGMPGVHGQNGGISNNMPRNNGSPRNGNKQKNSGRGSSGQQQQLQGAVPNVLPGGPQMWAMNNGMPMPPPLSGVPMMAMPMGQQRFVQSPRSFGPGGQGIHPGHMGGQRRANGSDGGAGHDGQSGKGANKIRKESRSNSNVGDGSTSTSGDIRSQNRGGGKPRTDSLASGSGTTTGENADGTRKPKPTKKKKETPDEDNNGRSDDNRGTRSPRNGEYSKNNASGKDADGKNGQKNKAKKTPASFNMESDFPTLGDEALAAADAAAVAAAANTGSDVVDGSNEVPGITTQQSSPKAAGAWANALLSAKEKPDGSTANAE
jgi:hypothetical protein